MKELSRQSALMGLIMKLTATSTWRLIFAVVAVLLFAYQIQQANQVIQGVLIDDAYISLRYADNVASGRGLSWQPGERVEGYTNFLWVAVMAVLMRLGLAGEAAAQWMGVAAGCGVLVLLVLLPRRLQSPLESRTWPVGVGALTVGASFFFPYWSNSGLETSLFILLCLIALLFTWQSLERPRRRRHAILAGLSLVGVALTRPDGLILFTVIVAVWLIYLLRSSEVDRRELGRSLSWTTGIFVVLYGAYFMWRLAYYGQLWPNPFYLKVGASLDQITRGLTYLQSTVEKLSALILLVVAPLALLPLPKHADQPAATMSAMRAVVVMMCLFASGYTVFLVYVGGDNFGPRLALTIFVVAAALADVGLSRAVSAWRVKPTAPRYLVPVVLGLAVIIVIHPWSSDLHAPSVRNAQLQINWKQLGLWLESQTNPADTIAVDAAGAIPYFSQRRAIDMLGLNDTHIAHLEVPTLGRGLPGHEKFDPAYVLAQSPDWLATWIDRRGQPTQYGLAGQPEMAHYQIYLVMQTADPAQPWMQMVTPAYALDQGWDAGYQYALWRRIPLEE